MFKDMKMPISEALMYALVGMVTVISILFLLMFLIWLISLVIRASEIKLKRKQVKLPPPAQKPVQAAKPQGIALPASTSQGELLLVETDESTAAMVMAIVSDMTDIPLNQLMFKRIKLLGEEKQEA